MMTVMNKKILIEFSTALVLMMSALAYAQSVPESTRDFALANADIPEMHDVTSMFLNPASLASLESQAIALNFYAMKDGVTDENIAAPISLGSNLMMGISTDIMHRGYPSSAGASYEARVLRWGAEVGVASFVSPIVSVGGSFATQYGKTNHSNAWGGNFSASVNYFPTSHLNYTLAVNDVGRGVLMDMTTANGPTARPYDHSGSVLGAIQMKYPSASTLLKPYLTFSFAAQKYFDNSTVYYEGGIEALPIRQLAIRGGYIYGHAKGEVTTGLGLILGPFELDYCFSPHNATGITQMFSVSFDPGY